MKKPEITLGWWIFMGMFLVSFVAIVMTSVIAIRIISADVNNNGDSVIIGMILFSAIWYSIFSGMVLSMWLVHSARIKEKMSWISHGRH